MAASQNRTITLTLNAQTSGADAIKDLANQVEKLGKTGGDARPEFEQLSQELNSLSAQRGAIESFNDLNTALNAAQTALKTSQTALSQEKAALDGLTTALNTAKAAEQQQTVVVAQATQDRQQANLELLKARSAYSEYVASIGGAKRATDEQKVVLRDLSQAIRTAKADYEKSRVSVMELTPEMDRLSEATKKAEAAVKEQGRAVSTVQKDVNAAKSSYDQLKTEMDGVSQTAQKVGVDLKNVASEQNRVTQAIGNSLNTLNTLQQRLEQTGNTAKTASQKIAEAFAGTGVQAINAAQAEILKIDQALLKLARDSTVLDSDFNAAFTAAKTRVAALEAEMRKTGKTAEGLGSSFQSALSQFGPASLVFNGVTAAIGAFTNAAREIPRVTMAFDSLSRTLTIVTGSTSQAAKEFEYLKGVAARTGVDILELSKGYAKLSAATKETAISGAQTKAIFEAVSGAMAALGASSSETSDALMAITQMVSKGVVSMEEMRQQLGERLPGAFQATAKALGITDGELNDLISSGKLATSDMLPALQRALEDMYKTGERVDTLTAKWERFKNVLKLEQKNVGDDWLDKILTGLNELSLKLVQSSEMLRFYQKVVANVGREMLSGGFGGGLDYIAKESEKTQKRIAELTAQFNGTTPSITKAAEAAKAAGQEFFVFSDGIKYATADVLKSNDGFIKMQVEMNKAQKEAENMATSQRKAAEYTRSAGEASITAANALGDESDKRKVATQVAENNAAALDKLVEAEKKVVAAMEAEALARAKAIQDGSAAEQAHIKQLKDLGDEIEKRKVVVDGIEKQRDAQRYAAEALDIEAQKLKDHSGDLQKLSEDYKEFARVLVIVRQAVKDGSLTQQQAQVIEDAARKTKALYIDAIKDQAANEEALAKQKKAKLDLDTQGVNLEIVKQKSIMQTAKLMGDEYTVQQAAIKIKKLEIELMEIGMQQKEAEARAILASVEAQKAELSVKNQLDPAKKAEIEALELSAKSKLKEAEISRETIKQLKELVEYTELYGDSSTNAAKGADKLADSLSKVGTAADNSAEKVKNLEAAQSSLYNKNGTRDGGTIDLRAGLYDKGATVEEANAAMQTANDEFTRQLQLNRGRMVSEWTRNLAIKDSYDTAVTLSLARARKELAAKNTDNSTSGQQNVVTPSMTPQAASTTTAQQTFTATGFAKPSVVNITIGGKTQAVNVASPADATQLANILKQLETQSLRAA